VASGLTTGRQGESVLQRDSRCLAPEAGWELGRAVALGLPAFLQQGGHNFAQGTIKGNESKVNFVLSPS